jgi:hypothetical protein
MWDHDLRFLSIAREDIEDLTLQDVQEAVMAQMTTDATEVSEWVGGVGVVVVGEGWGTVSRMPDVLTALRFSCLPPSFHPQPQLFKPPTNYRLLPLTHPPHTAPTHTLQISIVGDFEGPEVEELALKYLGSIPTSRRASPVQMRPLPPPVDDPGRRFMQVSQWVGGWVGGVKAMVGWMELWL